MVVASFNHRLSPAHYEGFFASPKVHKSNSGKGGAMLGVPFQSVKDGFLDLFDSTFLDAKARFERFSRFHSDVCFKPTRSCLSGLADYHGGLQTYSASLPRHSKRERGRAFPDTPNLQSCEVFVLADASGY